MAAEVADFQIQPAFLGIRGPRYSQLKSEYPKAITAEITD